ncbi:Flp family type IVb pilin [Qipengyuania nanhaisediminis]|uniref:Pilus assembly protein Flp/PilA n=1 Tax=Qipengyuania nanhaisediminis TaxID=604088 RepID=A0A1I5MCE9_9SPHN|nr:Flp family type IVb pilin [Qipengyuania nanhaisediminis]SFP07190.1 pilus assembly protein Flp/PilA [Qipengyuania nanhaisediminis]
MKFIKSLRRNEEGATAIEYGLIAALIAVAAITAMQNLGGEIATTYNAVDTELGVANGNAPNGV